MRLVQVANMAFTQIIEQLYLFLIFSWGIILLIGNFIAIFIIAIGFISWLADWHTTRGKRMIISGVILFLLLQWMGVSSPLMFPFLLS